MIEPKDLSLADLKKMHKAVREKKDCAKDNRTKAEAMIVLGMIDEELSARGYDVKKLFKDYIPGE